MATRCFTLIRNTLLRPRAADPARPAARRPMPAHWTAPQAQARRILLVCAQEDVRQVAAISLRRLGGHDVLAVDEIGQALARAADYRPDLLLLDAGARLARDPKVIATLRNEAARPLLPVVFLSANGAVAEFEALHALGARGVVLLPFVPVALLDAVGQALGAIA